MTALPYPTPNRLKLADAIAAGQVRHYPFQAPQTFNQTNGGLVTAKVQLLLDAGLVEVPEPSEHNYSIVRLTPEGMAWVTRARTSKISTEGEGSGSTEDVDAFIERGNAALLEAIDAATDTEANLQAIKNRAEGPGSTSPTGAGGAE